MSEFQSNDEQTCCACHQSTVPLDGRNRVKAHHYPSPPSLLGGTAHPHLDEYHHQETQQNPLELPPIHAFELPPPLLSHHKYNHPGTTSHASLPRLEGESNGNSPALQPTTPFQQVQGSVYPTPTVQRPYLAHPSSSRSSSPLPLPPYPYQPSHAQQTLHCQSSYPHYQQPTFQSQQQYHRERETTSPTSDINFASNPLLGLVTVATSALEPLAHSHHCPCCQSRSASSSPMFHPTVSPSLRAHTSTPPLMGRSTSNHSVQSRFSNQMSGERITLSPLRLNTTSPENQQQSKGSDAVIVTPRLLPLPVSAANLATPPLAPIATTSIPHETQSCSYSSESGSQSLGDLSSPREETLSPVNAFLPGDRHLPGPHRIDSQASISSSHASRQDTIEQLTVAAESIVLAPIQACTPSPSLRPSAPSSSSSSRRPRGLSSSSTKEASNSKDRPFTCPECQLSFTRKQNLKSHLTIHTNERPHVCSFEGCTSKFRRRQELLRHERSVHAQISPNFECPFCNKVFQRVDSFKKHLFMSSQGKLEDCQPNCSS